MDDHSILFMLTQESAVAERELANLLDEISEITHEIDKRKQDIFYYNKEIQTITNYFSAKQLRIDEQKKLSEQQKTKIYKQILRQIEDKTRRNFQLYFQLKEHQHLLASKENGIKKMDIGAVCIFYFEKNPYQYVSEQQVDENSDNIYSLSYVCKTFAIKKTTTIYQVEKYFQYFKKKLFNTACNYWNLNQDYHSITDESFNNLMLIINSTVEGFFNSSSSSFALFLIFHTVSQVDYLFDQQKECIKLTGGNTTSKSNKNDNLSKLYHELDDLSTLKPGLELYKGRNIGNPDDENNPDDQQKNEEIKFGLIPRTTLLIFNLVLIIAIINSALAQFDFKRTTFQKIWIMNQLLNQSRQFSNLSEIYNSVLNDTYLNLNNSLKYEYLTQVGEIQLLQVRTERYTCDSFQQILKNQNCFYPIFDTNNQQTSQLDIGNNTLEDWTLWQSSSESLFTSFIGLTSTYPGSGYIHSYDAYLNNTSDLDQLISQQFIDQNQTKMVSFALKYYDINQNIFIPLEYFLEKLSSNQIKEYIKFNFYRYSSDTPQDQQIKSLELQNLTIGIFVCVMQILMGIFEKKDEIQKKQKQKKPNERSQIKIWHLITFDFFFQFTIIILHLIQYILQFEKPNMSLREFIINGSSTNLMKYGENISLALKIKGFLIILVTINITSHIRTSVSITFVRMIFKRNAEQIIVIGVLVLIFMIALTNIYYQAFGQYLIEFSTFTRAFFSTWDIFLFGNTRLWDKCQQFNRSLNSLLTFICFFFITYGLLTLVNSIMQESYRVIQYQGDHMDEVKQYLEQFFNKIKQLKIIIKTNIKKIFTKEEGTNNTKK